MKKIIFLFAVVISSLSCSNAQTKPFSKKSQAQKLTDIDGKEVTFKDVLAKYKGKTIVMEVWASWCGDCVKAMPQMKELQAKNPDVTYLFLSLDKTVDKWKTGIEKYQIKGNHYLVNGGMRDSFGKALDLDWIPRYIVIDKNGKIVLYRAIETDFEKINTTLKSLN